MVQNRSPRNLGYTSLPARRRFGPPMQTYDALPRPLRQWLAQAALPWSPTSARRIWRRSQRRGLDIDATLKTLSKAEAQTLARDQFGTGNLTKTYSI
jgi:hypothetical protein